MKNLVLAIHNLKTVAVFKKSNFNSTLEIGRGKNAISCYSIDKEAVLTEIS